MVTPREHVRLSAAFFSNNSSIDLILCVCVCAHAHHTHTQIGDVETRVLQAKAWLLHGLRSKGLLCLCIINHHLAPLYIYIYIYIMKEGRKEGRNVCTCCFFGVPPPCVCVCGALSRCVFFSSFLAAVVVWRLLAGLCHAWPPPRGSRALAHALMCVCVCVCVCTTCGVAIGTLLLRDDSIAVRRPFKKGAVCCLLLSSLQQRVVGGGVCVCVHNTPYIY